MRNDDTPAELLARAWRAERNPASIAHAVARYCAANGFIGADVAARLGIGPELLAALMLCLRPRPERFEADLADIAWNFGADMEALANILAVDGDGAEER